MSSSSFEIPAGLTELLQDFTVAVLRRKPPDLYQFAVDYFVQAQERRSSDLVNCTSSSQKGASFGGGGGECENNNSHHSSPEYSDEEMGKWY